MARTPRPHAEAARALRRASGTLSTAAVARMEAEYDWFRTLSAEERSWIGLIVQAGIRGFVEWFGGLDDADNRIPEASGMVGSVFGAAPSAMAGIVTLEQTVAMVRLAVEVVEDNIDDVLGAEIASEVHFAVLRYGREVAFATAEVYARAAEIRGAWDARLEALVVDAVLRDETDETVLSRASAVGWGARGDVAVVLGTVPSHHTEAGVVDAVRRAASSVEMDVLCAVQGHRLVVILGGVSDADKDAAAIVDLFDPANPVVVGPITHDLGSAHRSAQAALAGLRAAVAWPDAPRPVSSDDLLPERILAGDPLARRDAEERIYRPLTASRGTLVDTLTAYFDHGGRIEAAARALFVHPNTIRYRLGQVADLTGCSPTRPRDALALRLALVIGRLAEAEAPSPPA